MANMFKAVRAKDVHAAIAYWKIQKYKYRLARACSITIPVRPAKTVMEPRPPREAYVTLTRRGRLTIRARYAWDGASGPMPDFRSTMRASLVHDALYQLSRAGALPPSSRKAADRTFRELCIEDGLNRPLAWFAYCMLRVWGGMFARKQSDLITAP